MLYSTFVSTVEQVGGITADQITGPYAADGQWQHGAWRLQRMRARRPSARSRRLCARSPSASPGGEARDTALMLPRRRPLMERTPEEAERFGRDELPARREARGHRPPHGGRARPRRLRGARRRRSPGELREMASQLPAEYDPLLQAAG